MSKFKPGDVVRNQAGTGGTIKCRSNRFGGITYDYTDGEWDHEESLTLVRSADEATLGDILATALTPKYKIGDRVEIGHDGLYIRDHGTIREIFASRFKADWDDGNGNGAWFAFDKIRPSTKPKLGQIPERFKSPSIVARCERGQYLAAMYPRVHDTDSQATREAERLAVANPGASFAVFTLASISTALAPKPVQPTVTTVRA